MFVRSSCRTNRPGQRWSQETYKNYGAQPVPDEDTAISKFEAIISHHTGHQTNREIIPHHFAVPGPTVCIHPQQNRILEYQHQGENHYEGQDPPARKETLRATPTHIAYSKHTATGNSRDTKQRHINTEPQRNKGLHLHASLDITLQRICT